MNTIKVGDILLNDWTSCVAGRYSIIYGIGTNYVDVIHFHKGKLGKGRYYKNHVLKDEEFKVVGHTTAFSIMKEDLLKFQRAEEMNREESE